MLSVKNLTVSIGEKKILDNVSFDFEEGKIYAIMGPNGSGKSTLAYSIMGHPGYEMDTKSAIELDGTNIIELEPDKRSEKGIFLSFQSPLSLSGVRLSQLLHYALQGKKNPLEIRDEVKKYAHELQIREDLLSRSLNEGASGGERKKLEVLQAAVLEKKLLIFDEVDTGVDVDALKTIAKFLNTNRRGKTYILITHYNRILKYLKPDKILVIADGKLQRVGDHALADEIEKDGYDQVIANSGKK
jgi:Fe-S cluster assembly ATP-binding protein